jgi:Fic-DOC domain mobile mystery protein B
MEINSPPGATLIEPDDLNDLIPRLTIKEELNEFEHRNIFKAIIAARKSRKLKRDLLNIDSLTWLHSQMFKDTWQWAGEFRTRQTNIGVEPHQIQDQLAILCADAKYWIENSTYELPVCAVRIHHRLAKIHPFYNGNGRHARLVADLMMFYNGQPEFNWGGRRSLDLEGEIRQRYLAALGKADAGNYNELIQFATQLH